jgi:hypothetical protein
LRASPAGAGRAFYTGHAKVRFNNRLRARVGNPRTGIHLEVTSIA